jgi:hypothetical protein
MQLYKKWGWSKAPSRPAVIKKDFLLHGNLHDEGRMRLRAAETEPDLNAAVKQTEFLARSLAQLQVVG